MYKLRCFLGTLALLMIPALTVADNPLTLPSGGTVDVTWYTPSSVRVVKTPGKEVVDKASLSVIAEPQSVKVKVNDASSTLSMSSAKLSVSIDKATGAVTFTTPKGQPLMREAGSAEFKPVEYASGATYEVAQSFDLEADEAIFGLGILQNGKMSQRGENRTLMPGNTDDGIPFIQSVKGYGLYWDNYSATNFADVNNVVTFTSESGNAVDYYFMYGGNADGVVSEIRELTGDAPMIPLWSYGFHQSKERYKSQDETVDVLHHYRKDGVPMDCIIQDWQYWGPNYLWNAMEFMSDAFPNPQAMMDDIHKNNAHCMISIWSSFGPMTKPYRELNEKGLLFNMETWPQSGISHIWPPRMDYPSGVRVYDCYSPEARDIYWNNLSRLYSLGLDGWWMDSTEPDHFNWKEEDFDHVTAMGPYRSVRLAYPIMTVGGVYDHQRGVSDSTRVIILTRSGAFGQQRYASNVWSGDVVSTWDMLRNQVTAGLNFSLTGNPYFNSDLGGFFAGSYNGAWKGKPAYENPAYRELYTRWMQQGVFTPMMRSHGADVPRELFYYGEAGEPVYDALLGAIKLRYKLMPYIYSTAWQVSKNRGTFMRALAMDFPTDKQAVEQKGEYMFGNAILATPVLKANYTPEIARRDRDANAGWDKNTGRTTMENLDNVDFNAKHPHTAYLPGGSKWYYFADNSVFEGGKEATVDVALTDNPFFVKAGSILPLGPDVQYASEKPWDELEIRVYSGANGDFTLYEDEGDNYNYEKGVYTEIPFIWNDKSRTLTIGKREGQYPGMLTDRKFKVVYVGDKGLAEKTVDYSGKKLNIRF